MPQTRLDVIASVYQGHLLRMTRSEVLVYVLAHVRDVESRKRFAANTEDQGIDYVVFEGAYALARIELKAIVSRSRERETSPPVSGTRSAYPRMPGPPPVELSEERMSVSNPYSIVSAERAKR